MALHQDMNARQVHCGSGPAVRAALSVADIGGASSSHLYQAALALKGGGADPPSPS